MSVVTSGNEEAVIAILKFVHLNYAEDLKKRAIL